AAANMSDASYGEINDAAGQAAGIHKLTSQNEKGYCQQREGIHAGNHVLRDDLRVEHSHVPHENHTAEHERESERNADSHGAEKRADKYDARHVVYSIRWSSECSPAKVAISSSVKRPVTARRKRSAAMMNIAPPVNNPTP